MRTSRNSEGLLCRRNGLLEPCGGCCVCTGEWIKLAFEGVVTSSLSDDSGGATRSIVGEFANGEYSIQRSAPTLCSFYRTIVDYGPGYFSGDVIGDAGCSRQVVLEVGRVNETQYYVFANWIQGVPSADGVAKPGGGYSIFFGIFERPAGGGPIEVENQLTSPTFTEPFGGTRNRLHYGGKVTITCGTEDEGVPEGSVGDGCENSGGSSDPGSSDPGSSNPDSSSGPPGSSDPGSSTPGSSNPGGGSGASSSDPGGCSGIVCNGCCLRTGTWSYFGPDGSGSINVTKVNSTTLHYEITSGGFAGGAGSLTCSGTGVRVQASTSGYDDVRPVTCVDGCTTIDFGGGNYWQACGGGAGSDGGGSSGGGSADSGASSAGSGPIDLNDVVFVSQGEAPSGDWIGLYGPDGYAMAGGVATVTPSYVDTLNILGSEYVWAYTTSDGRALLNPDDPPTRIAATYESSGTLQIEIGFNDTAMHFVAFQILNWDDARIQQRVIGIDDSGEQTNHLVDLTGGKAVWIVYQCRRNVRFQFTDSAIYNPIASGIFFGRVELP